MMSKRNILLMYLIKFCKGLMFSVSITYLFYNSHNLTAFDLYVVQAVFAIGVVLFEIPTGFLSDKYSRKISIIVGLLLYPIGYLLYSQGSDLLTFVGAEIILVLGYCCISGTDTSLIYDSMAQDKRLSEYKKVSGKYFSIGSFAEGIGGVLGAYIAAYYALSTPYLIDAIFVGVAVIVALFLIEPKREKFSASQGNLVELKRASSFLTNHKKVLLIVLFSALMNSLTMSMSWFAQPYMDIVNLPIVYIGWFWFALNSSSGIASLLVERVEKKIGEKFFMLMVVVVAMLSMFFLASFPYLWMLPVFFLFQFVRQGVRLISTDNLHILTSSDIRATIQSLSSMVFRLCFAVRGPLFGWLYISYGLQVGLIVGSIVLGGIALAITIQFGKLKE